MGRPYVDTYFKDDDDILAVYDFDYESSIDFYYRLGIRQTMCIGCAIPYCWVCIPCIAAFVYLPVFKDNVTDAIEAQHLGE